MFRTAVSPPGRDFADAADEDLLVLYAKGDMGAAKELMERLTPKTLRLAGGMLGNAAEAEEVVQESMLRLWKVAPDWDPGRAKVSTWLWRVCTNLCTDVLRRRRGIGLDEIPEPVDDSPSAEEMLVADQRSKALRRALAKLPARQRAAVILRHIEGLPNPRIAEILETSVEAVESLISRGLRGLKAELRPQREALGWRN